MPETISSEHTLSVLHSFYKQNAGDEATTDIILNIGVELLDVSQDELLDEFEDMGSEWKPCHTTTTFF